MIERTLTDLNATLDCDGVFGPYRLGAHAAAVDLPLWPPTRGADVRVIEVLTILN